MKKLLKDLLNWYILLIILFLGMFVITDLFNVTFLTEKNITIICFFLSVPFYIVLKKLINNKHESENKIVKNISQKYKDVVALNNKYSFKKIDKMQRKIIEKEYSHRGYDRARANTIILYNIENNQDNIREFILDAYRNKKNYDLYMDEYNKIEYEVSDDILREINFSRSKYNEVEKRIINQILYTKKVYNISIKVIVVYSTPSGNNTYKKQGIIDYDRLCDLYMQWRNGKKYKETSKRERKYLSDEMRYDVLKRDNYKCRICGASAKDGAKLHVDHIVPVSKGGKTTLSNLQTLCDRCNLGKSNKDM